jgi:hypothetical protein
MQPEEKSWKQNPGAFVPFPKIARLNRDCVITEKIDGTNAQVEVCEDGSVIAGSRSRYLTLKDDNFGFARWVQENEDDLRKLGVGRHYGEWWGSGINRGYGLTKGEKRFSLFNVARWEDDTVRPASCSVVPVLYRGAFHSMSIAGVIEVLRMSGSFASLGFMNPEGVIIWHEAARQLFKVTLDGDEKPKGQIEAEQKAKAA